VLACLCIYIPHTIVIVVVFIFLGVYGAADGPHFTEVVECCRHLLCIVVSAILEHEAIAGLSAGKPSGLRGRLHRGSVSEDRNKDLSLDMLIKAVCD